MYLPIVPILLATTSPMALAEVPAPPPVVFAVQAGEIAGQQPADQPYIEAQQVPQSDQVLAYPVLADQVPGVQVLAEPNPDDFIIVEGSVVDTPGDPLENINATSYEITQGVDRAIVGPVAQVYEEELPKPLRNGLRNLLRNLMEPVNFINHLLQLRPGRALATVGRFAINSTIGIGGLFDIAAQDPFDLEYRRNGFSNTLGYYGVGQGPFLVLPLIGATTLRDLVGSTIDQAVVPFALGAPFNTPYYAIPAYTINSLQYRIEVDERLDAISDSDDPYMAMRESYLCLREADIAALRDLPAPRDCSIASLMANDEAEFDDADYAEAEAEPVAIPASPVVVVVPAEPVIEFVTVPVVQAAP